MLLLCYHGNPFVLGYIYIYIYTYYNLVIQLYFVSRENVRSTCFYELFMLFGVTAFELVASAIVYSVTIETLVLGKIYNIIFQLYLVAGGNLRNIT